MSIRMLNDVDVSTSLISTVVMAFLIVDLSDPRPIPKLLLPTEPRVPTELGLLTELCLTKRSLSSDSTVIGHFIYGRARHA